MLVKEWVVKQVKWDDMISLEKGRTAVMLKNRFYSRFYNKPTLDYLLERIDKIEAAGHDIVEADPSLLDEFNTGCDGYDVLGTKKSQMGPGETVTDTEERPKAYDDENEQTLRPELVLGRRECQDDDCSKLIERIYKMESKITNISSEIHQLRILIEGSGK